jgi:hypothetical protein
VKLGRLLQAGMIWPTAQDFKKHTTFHPKTYNISLKTAMLFHELLPCKNQSLIAPTWLNKSYLVLTKIPNIIYP